MYRFVVFRYVFIGVSILMLLSVADILITREKLGLSFMLMGMCVLIGFTFITVYTNVKIKEAAPFYDQTVSLSGRVVDVEQNEHSKTLTVQTDSIGEAYTSIKFPIRVYGETPNFEIGQTIEGTVNLAAPDGLLNDGVFYYPDYLKSKGYFLTGTAQGEELFVMALPDYKDWKTRPAQIRGFIRSTAYMRLPKENAGLLVGIMLGDKSGMSNETQDDFRVSGISHLTAVSGLHVSLILSFLMVLFWIFGNRRSLARIFYIAGILFVIIITGASASVMRAGIMILLFQIGWLIRRESDGINSLCLAGVIILLWNPYGIYDVGFQLSFCATFGILVLSPLLEQAFHVNQCKIRVLRFFCKAATVTLAAQIGTFPITVSVFHRLPILATITNVLVAPIVPLLLASGILLVAIQAIIPPLSVVSAIVANTCLSILRAIAAFVAHLPIASLPYPSLSLLKWLAYGFFVFGLWCYLSKKKRILSVISMSMVLLFLVGSLSFRALDRDTATVSFINVGHGESALVQVGDTSLLLDGGSRSMGIGEYVLDDFLYDKGIITLSGAVITHFDADHTNGIEFLMENGRVGKLFLPATGDESEEKQVILSKAQERGIPIVEIHQGERISLSESVYLDCLSPSENETFEDDNDASLVFLLSANGRTFFFGGDIGEAKEKDLLHHDPSLHADVMKANHHGSKNSNCSEFLNCISPQIVVVSYGKNSYGHPSSEAMTRFREIGAGILRTKENGTITFRVTKQGKMYLKTTR